MGFCLVALAGLELLDSSDPPASVSQGDGIIGVSHYAQPTFYFLFLQLPLFLCVDPDFHMTSFSFCLKTSFNTSYSENLMINSAFVCLKNLSLHFQKIFLLGKEF